MYELSYQYQQLLDLNFLKIQIFFLCFKVHVFNQELINEEVIINKLEERLNQNFRLSRPDSIN